MYMSSSYRVLVSLYTSFFILDLKHSKDRDLYLLSVDTDPFSISTARRN